MLQFVNPGSTSLSLKHGLTLQQDVILEKWQETLAQNHNLDGLRFPWWGMGAGLAGRWTKLLT